MAKTTTKPELHSTSYTAKFEVRMVTSEGRNGEGTEALANALSDVYSGRYVSTRMAEVEITGYKDFGDFAKVVEAVEASIEKIK